MRFGSTRHHGAARGDPAEPAIIADIAFAVGSDRSAIGAAGNFRDHLFAPVGPNPRQPPAADFDQHHRSVRHHHRPFRKFEIGGEHADVGHENPPGFSWAPADSSSSRTRNSLRDVMAKSISLAKQSAGMRLCRPRGAGYSLTGTQISRPPFPVSGSKFSSYRSKLGASAAFNP